MNNNSYEVANLIKLIGLDRFSNEMQAFLSSLPLPPVITVDKADDAYDEFIEFKSLGFGLAFDKDMLVAVSLHSSDAIPAYSRYDNPLPLGLCFEQSKSEVLDLLGGPDVEGGGHDDFFGDIPYWVKYNTIDCIIHIEFNTDLMSIQMVTLM